MSKVDITAAGAWAEGDEGVLVTWLFKDGASVTQGDVVAEIMLEKVEMELEAPASGTLNILSQADDVITHNSVIGTIETE